MKNKSPIIPVRLNEPQNKLIMEAVKKDLTVSSRSDFMRKAAIDRAKKVLRNK